MYPEFNDPTINHTNPEQNMMPQDFMAEQQPVQPQEPTYAIPQYQPTEPVVPQYQPTEPTIPQYQPSEPVAPQPPKKKGKAVKWLGVVALCLVCSLLGGLIGAYAYGSVNNDTPTSNQNIGNSVILEGNRQPTVITPVEVDTNRLMTPAEVYATFVNSTVGITTSITTNYWGYQSTSAASGSGFILSEDGYVITNFHVIEDSSAITVSMNDGTEYAAKLVGYDESNDVAVLKIDAKNLTPVVLGKSGNMHVGDNVVAIGNPLGELTFSLTSGTVSALNRDVTMSNGLTMTLIQTDCAINSGNSGGALFNMYGEVIGITNAKYSSSSYGEASIDNIGFAIPIDDVKYIIESIVEKGYISKPYIGVSVTDVSQESQKFGLPKGAAVSSITEGSPAEASGLQLNDIITKVNDTEITSSSDLVAVVRACQVNETLTLTVYRMGQTIELPITVGEQVQSGMQQQQQGQTPSQGGSLFPFWGN